MKKIFLLVSFILLASGCVQQGEIVASTTTPITLKPASSTVPHSITSTLAAPTTLSLPLGGFEIHEWGVMVGCTTNDSFFLTSRPEQTVLVKQPVIYVHSSAKTPFSVKATFSGGKPTETYPTAKIDGATVSWESVTFPGDDKPATKAAAVGYNYVPLENIIHTLNDVDSDMLESAGQKTRFLYYEGEMNYANRLSAVYDLQEQEAYLTNANEYPVYDVILVLSKEGASLFSPDVYTGRAQEIPANSRIKVSLFRQETINLQDDLVAQGFTEREALSFATLWKGTFLYQSNTGGWGHLIYRLPQTQYEKMISLEVTPQPDKMIRTLYVLVQLDNQQ